MKITKTVIILFIALCSMLIPSCASPEKDGAALGLKINECNRQYLNTLQQLDINFGKNDSYNSRKSIKAAYFTAKSNANSNYRIALDEIYKVAADKKNSYGDYKSQSEFSRAYANAIDSDLQNSVQLANANTQLPSTVLAYMKSIIPTKPDISQIQKDLIGHSLSEGVENGYYSSSWRWLIENNEISEFHIDKTLTDNANEYMIIAKMRLTSDVGKAFNATVKIRYILPDDDDWIIDFTQSQGMYIVKTHLYDDCVTVEKDGWWYYLRNQCDVALEVGGKELEYNGWKKYCHVISAHNSYCIYNPDDIIIDYVERP